MSVQLEKWCFTVDDYHRMSEAGILSEGDRVELIRGEIVRMSPIGKSHAACVNRLNAVLNRRIGDLGIVSVQNPIRLDDFSEPQPDIALLKPRADFYSRALPGPEDVLLIIEVADSSADNDRRVKVPLYASAGIPEVWLIDLLADTIEVHAQPAGGSYQHYLTASRDNTLSPAQLANLNLSVVEMLG